jgi:hypothetical protein
MVLVAVEKAQAAALGAVSAAMAAVAVAAVAVAAGVWVKVLRRPGGLPVAPVAPAATATVEGPMTAMRANRKPPPHKLLLKLLLKLLRKHRLKLLRKQMPE